MKDNPALPLTDNGKGSTSQSVSSAPRRLGLVSRLKLWRVPLLIVFLFTGAVAGMYFQGPPMRVFFELTGLEPGAGTSTPIAVAPPQPAVAPEPAPPSITALGRLMPEGDVVRLAAPFGAGDSRVARLLVTEGEVVAKGQLIAELDSLPQYRAALSTAQANLAAKKAVLVQARASVAAALTEAQANRDRAASVAALAEEEAARYRDLMARGVTTKVVLNRAAAAAVQAVHNLDRAEAQLARQKGGEDQPDVALAARQLDTARADLAQAEGVLAKGQVLAPQAGRILTFHVRAGEKPGTAGIATLGATDKMEAELEVYQTDIARVSYGQTVTLTSPALIMPLTGTVTGIGLEVERQTVLAADPAANTDARIVRVKVALDPVSSARAAALTGLEVTGRIITDGAETETAQ